MLWFMGKLCMTAHYNPHSVYGAKTSRGKDFHGLWEGSVYGFPYGKPRNSDLMDSSVVVAL